MLPYIQLVIVMAKESLTRRMGSASGMSYNSRGNKGNAENAKTEGGISEKLHEEAEYSDYWNEKTVYYQFTH